MRKALLTSALMLLGLAANPARAMPVAPVSGAPMSITQVAQGCGPGWYRGPYGRCHPMGAVAKPLTRAPSASPSPPVRPIEPGDRKIR
jgi:hypothetical protein